MCREGCRYRWGRTVGFVTEKGSPMRRSIIILVSVLALAASACGGDITEDEFKDQLMEDGLVDETQAQCIVDGLGDAGISLQSVTDEELGDDPLPAAAAAVVAECVFADLDMGTTDPADLTEEGVGDPVLDELYAQCEAGNGEACDDLFLQSPIGSRYESFGNLCGDRFEITPGLCASVDLG